MVNPRLVRGLDYYSRTVFEWVTSDLGSQDAVCSGGRYDGLVAQLGGDAVPAIGWALGEERIVELMRLQGLVADEGRPDVYVVLAGEAAEAAGVGLAERIRDAASGPAGRDELRRRQLQVAAEARGQEWCAIRRHRR